MIEACLLGGKVLPQGGAEFLADERQALPLAIEFAAGVAELQGVIDFTQLALIDFQLGLRAAPECHL